MQPNFSFPLDRDSEEPLYRQLIRQIKLQIESGQLPAGTRLPASRELAEQINISRISVVNAYAELRAEGYLSAHAGRGTFVNRDSGKNNPLGNAHTRRTTPASSAPAHNTQEIEALNDYSLRDMMRLAKRTGIINFSHGAPPPDFYPMNQLREAINAILERDGVAALGYEQSEGYAPLRAAVRDYVSGLGIRCSADSVLITAGAQQALDLAIQSLAQEGDTIITANPTYLGILDIARARRVNVHSIPADDEGMRLDYLEQYLMDGHRPRLIFVMPTFHNPTGAVMPLHRRRQLINLANEYRIPILEDAVYHELRFEGENIPLLRELDDSGVVIHISAFSKILLPGLRIGYMIASKNYLERLVRVKAAADISTSGLNQRAMLWLIQRGMLAYQLEHNNRELHRRRDAAITALQKHFPEGTTWNRPQGGLYLWVKLPKHGPTGAELFMTAAKKDVSFAIGSVFYTNNGGAYNLRLNYGLQRPELIDEGFRRIGQAWRELMGEYHTVEKSPLL
jgi:GntR family transcriptional regulator/MocR family aminotransferase